MGLRCVGDLPIAALPKRLMHIGLVVSGAGHSDCDGVHRLLHLLGSEGVPVFSSTAEGVAAIGVLHLILELVDLHLVAVGVVAGVVLAVADHDCDQ